MACRTLVPYLAHSPTEIEPIAYHFEPSGSFASQFHKIARSQIENAITSLENVEAEPEESIHDARKRFKKIRGLLRLFRPGLDKIYRKENVCFRDLGRGLSATRDAQVLCETVARLGNAVDGDELRRVLTRLQDWAGQRRENLSREKTLETADQCRDSLHDALKRTGDWDIDGDPLEACLAGFSNTYKRARDEFGNCREGGRPQDRHEWRKRVKYHWYHCRLLREAWPDVMIARAGDLHAVADALGDDHDLIILLQTMHDDKSTQFSSSDIALIRELADGISRKRREKALALAPKLFTDKPKELRKRIRSYWMLAAAHEELAQ